MTGAGTTGAAASGAGASATSRVEGARGVIVLHGEIDHASVGELDTHVKKVLEAGVTEVVVSFGSVTFFDSACLAALVRAREAVVERGGRVVLSDVNRYALRILELTGLDAVFTIEGQVRAS
ncbi:STAS domain-containing protein [Streptoalloteichus tenebrarius]|uniref:STAS domain-containing protein n=1 Tax=Streptoalloteichus tenebrarius (strain ATCC 17920 / DSM 40477 / JCM 4838 / CBS 697.72 / NBRC 16177 / NCIMB 11028 / NRRL B-12390 / A12253. 1 / ISP 5477) TaxID=1933 RepID=UPI0020A45792|nr:STAS domain-containing protein [Streptoalloteichus tenebrarius]